MSPFGLRQGRMTSRLPVWTHHETDHVAEHATGVVAVTVVELSSYQTSAGDTGDAERS